MDNHSNEYCSPNSEDVFDEDTQSLEKGDDSNEEINADQQS